MRAIVLFAVSSVPPAAAEAVMMVEVVGESDYWTEVKDRMRVS